MRLLKSLSPTRLNLYISPPEGKVLTIEDLSDVIDALEDASISNANWEPLGLRLGLLEPKLREIEEDQNSKPARCMRHVLSNWLQQNYNTDKKGEPSWGTLADALERINGRAAIEIRS